MIDYVQKYEKPRVIHALTDIKNKLHGFIKEIKITRNNCKNDGLLNNYDTAIKLVQELLDKQEAFVKNDFNKLARYVDDCLPWSENILNIWNNIEKQRNCLCSFFAKRKHVFKLKNKVKKNQKTSDLTP